LSQGLEVCINLSFLKCHDGLEYFLFSQMDYASFLSCIIGSLGNVSKGKVLPTDPHLF
jgi:hypothetical protein